MLEEGSLAVAGQNNINDKKGCVEFGDRIRELERHLNCKSLEA